MITEIMDPLSFVLFLGRKGEEEKQLTVLQFIVIQVWLLTIISNNIEYNL